MSEQPGPLILLSSSPSKKEVLVSYGKRTKSVSLNRDNGPKIKLTIFEEKAKAMFEYVMTEQNSELFMQLKDEKWQGEFVDLTPSAYITDKSVVQMASYIKFYAIVHMHACSYICIMCP